jgi:hypothetical protein
MRVVVRVIFRVVKGVGIEVESFSGYRSKNLPFFRLQAFLNSLVFEIASICPDS